MRQKQWELLGLWAMGLILFVATFIVIRWAINFATWSALSPDWAQAIGGFLAIIAAFLIGAQQSKTAIAVVYAGAKIVEREQMTALQAQVRLAYVMATSIEGIFRREAFDELEFRMRYQEPKLKGLLVNLQSIPPERLTTLAAVEAHLMICNALEYLLVNIARAEQQIPPPGNFDITAQLRPLPIASVIRLNCSEIKKQCMRLKEYSDARLDQPLGSEAIASTDDRATATDD